jgi:hypothetical protein
MLHPADSPSDLNQSVAKAISYFEDSNEPDALLWLDVMHRRFGIEAFADALQRYDQEVAARPEQAPLLRIFRRIADYNNLLMEGDLQAVTAKTDYVTVPALYSDRIALPANYLAILAEAVDDGKYMLTHALLAWVWVQENGCDFPMSNSFIERLYSNTSALIDDNQVVTDLELEAAAFLYLAGQEALVSETFVERVIAAQNYDGGWSLSSETPENSEWHTTILGLFLLLQVEYSAESYAPMLASVPT